MAPSSSPPVGEIVPTALRALDRGGILAVAGIYLTDIPALNYEQPPLPRANAAQRPANTRHDGRRIPRIAAKIVHSLDRASIPFDEADHALSDLAHEKFSGAAVPLTSIIGAPTTRRRMNMTNDPVPGTRMSLQTWLCLGIEMTPKAQRCTRRGIQGS